MRIIIEPDRPSPRVVKAVSNILKNGGIVVYPTDTVYGIGCSLSNKKGIEKIMSLKEETKPRSIMLSDLKHISDYAIVENEAFRLIRKILPGPYTVILPATRLVPKLMQSNRKTIGIRVPDHWFCRALIEELGEPVLNTSVPLGENGMHVDPIEIESDFGHIVDMIVDSGLLTDIPSTIISFENKVAEILRQGLGPLDFMEK